MSAASFHPITTVEPIIVPAVCAKPKPTHEQPTPTPAQKILACRHAPSRWYRIDIL